MAEWHIITCEYPPQVGGVSDYTKLVAEGLAEAGDEVHVWAPRVAGGNEGKGQRAKGEGEEQESRGRQQAAGVTVHRELGRFRPSDLRRVGKHLDQFPSPRRLLVQWVPHGYGYRAMNIWFCVWLWWRAKFKRDRVELMVHEPFLAFREGSWKQDLVAVVHRVMMAMVLNAASRVRISIPGWESRLRPYAFGRRLRYEWLPIPSNLPVVIDSVGVRETRRRYAHNGNLLVGHFGTGEPHITDLLLTAMTSLVKEHAELQLLLIGLGSEQVLTQLTQKVPNLMGKVQATGWLPPHDLSLHVSACDLMLQPYPDGISSRRTSAMVSLSHGTPVITTTGHLTEPMWAESTSVALAPVEKIDNVAGLTADLFSDSRERERVAAVAKKLYRERFDIRHTIEALRAGLT